MRERRIGSVLTARLAMWAGMVLLSGLLAATLIRMAPGLGMDERLLDARLSSGAREAIEGRSADERNVLGYYRNYLARMARGNLGVSLAYNRPVRDLLRERMATSVRSGAAGLGLAWLIGLAAVAALETVRRRAADAMAASAAGALLCVPAAVAALACVYAGAGAAVAIAVILAPRLFRYLRSLAAQACGAPHVVMAYAMGIPRGRMLALHVAAPVMADLAALAGVSVSMAVGAAIPAEALCDSPGVGHLLWQAALARDVPVLVNVTLVITAVTAGANLLADAVRGMGPREREIP
jgi:peptide/nickel transport system permease protein